MSGIRLGRAFVIGSLLAACSALSVQAQSSNLTVTSYGGNYQEAQDKAYFQPFAAATPGLTIRQDTQSNNAKLKAMVEAGNVSWDLVLVDDSFGLDANAQWLEPIDYSIVDKSKFIDGYAENYRVGSDIEATVITYRSDVIKGEGPKDFAEFFDVKKFPGKRALWKYSASGLFEAALIADGVPADKLYPIDVERALKKLDTIKDEIVWWESGAQAQQFLSSGETPLALVWVTRAIGAAESAPVAINWGQWTTQNGYWVVPKGTKNKEMAMRAIQFFTQVPQQVAFTKYIPYGPTNKNAVEQVDARYKGNIPTDHLKSRVVLNSAWWAENQPKVDAAFQEWLLQ